MNVVTYVAEDPDDEEEIERQYEGGHWAWDEDNGRLVFLKHEIPDSDLLKTISVPVFAGPIEFKTDLDVIEEQRFKRRYQRKIDAHNDIVTLQDVKDVVLFSAPLSILSESVINMLHLPMTDRFLRTLILYCQYYVQISDEMSQRALDQLVKIRTSGSIETEMVFKENLDDLRLLVAKEYCSMIAGGESYRKYHHMGPQKKSRSLSKKDAVLFETVLRIAIQIAWVAIGRKNLNKIEVEVHRLFKSPIFNVVEHGLHTGFYSNMSPEERTVLLGNCVQKNVKLKTRSPLMNEITGQRDADFRLLGLGLVNYPRLSHRLLFLERILLAPERTFPSLGITLGVIGMPRSKFDTMLRGMPQAQRGATSIGSLKSSTSRDLSKTSRPSVTGQKSITKMENLFPDLVIPEKSSIAESWPEEFPLAPVEKTYCDDVQRRRWLHRLKPTFARGAKRGRSEDKGAGTHSKKDPLTPSSKVHK